jgi:nucleoside-diphosphate-sugar epimerase
MRVAAQFARKALAHEDIELHTQGDSVMNCCDTIDAVYALLTIICKGEDGEAYNVANPAASMAVHKMAELVARDVCGGKIKVVIRVPDNIAARGYAPDVGYSLNINKLKALGWEPHYGLADMFCRMLEGWKTE